MNTAIESGLSFVLNGLWRASWQASLLALVVLITQRLLGARLGGRGRFALWAVVVVRLLLPVLPESRFSVFNLAKSRSTPGAVALKPVPAPAMTPTEQSDIPVIVIGSSESTRPQAAKSDGEVARKTLVAPISPHAIHWSAWIFAAWLAGVATLSLRVAQVCWELSRTIRKLTIVTDSELMRVAKACATTLRLRRMPVVLAGEDVQTPAVVGLFRPKLLLPSHVLTACDAQEIRLILLHELAHLKRHDIAGNWLIALASVLHWFNPVVWLLSARMRADRELACDELVLAHSAGEARAYGNTLLKLIEILSPKMRSIAVSPRELAIVGILESTTPMQRRVRMIAKFDPKQSRRWIWTVPVMALLATVALTDAVRGEKPTSPAPEAAPAPATNPSMVLHADTITVSTAPPAPQTESEIRAYDINSLIVGANLDRNNEISAIKNALTNLVDTHSWTEAKIEEVNGKLIIQQTPANHDKIAELLKLLSSEQPAQPPTPGAGPSPVSFSPGQMQPSVARTVVSDDQIETANRAALASLHKKVPEVKFDNTSFSDVIDFFRDITGANIAVNWRALESAGVDKNAPVTVRLKDASFETVLNSTLRQIDAQGTQQVAIVIDQGVITVTTQWDLPYYMLTKTYDVKDLLGENAPVQSLVTVIQNLGPQGGVMVQSFGTKLIVTAVPDGHEQVEKLLAELRSGSTTKPAAK